MRRPIRFQDRQNHCFGCGADNPAGLRLDFVETAEGVEIEYAAPEELAGAPGVIHGGVQATLLDEAMCMTAYAKAGTPVVTGELSVRYVKPAPTGERVVVRGRIAGTKGRSFFIEGTIRLAATGEELARARGRFFADTSRPLRAAALGAAAPAQRPAGGGRSPGPEGEG